MMSAPSPIPAAQAERRRPSRHSIRQPSTSGSPHGAAGIKDGAANAACANHAPGSAAGAKRTAASAATPTGSHSNANAQKPHRPADTILSVQSSPREPRCLPTRSITGCPVRGAVGCIDDAEGGRSEPERSVRRAFVCPSHAFPVATPERFPQPAVCPVPDAGSPEEDFRESRASVRKMGGRVPRLPGAATAKEVPTMFGIDTDHDPITPSNTELLEELGLDALAVRETLVDDLSRRYPDCAVTADGDRGGLEESELKSAGERVRSLPFANPSSIIEA